MIQHLNGQAQSHYKEKILFDNLSRIGRVSPGIRMPMIQGPTSHYRRKARLGVKTCPKKGRYSGWISRTKKQFCNEIAKMHHAGLQNICLVTGTARPCFRYGQQ